MEMGINWWQHDSFLTTSAKEKEMEEENVKLNKRIELLEEKINSTA